MALDFPATEVLIMTATIKVGQTPYVAILNEKERLLDYLCAIVSWVKSTRITQIIFCENSNTSYDFSKIKEFAENEGKSLEVLVFDGNNKSKWRGKSYGEGEIMEYAIARSQNLSERTNFYKITGRLFIPEFDRIRTRYAECTNVFQLTQQVAVKNIKMDIKRYLFSITRGIKGAYNPNIFVQTYFYKANVGFFKQNLLNSYNRSYEWWGYRLENAYYDDLLGKNFTILEEKFRTIGRSGTSGNIISADHSDEIKNLAKTFL